MDLTSGTAVNGPNTWLDLFDYGTERLDGIGEGYIVFNNVQSATTRTFRRNNHWIVEVDAISRTGGAVMRPDRTFRFVDGMLVAEGDVALRRYGDGNVWAEIDVTTASQPARPIAGQGRTLWIRSVRRRLDFRLPSPHR